MKAEHSEAKFVLDSSFAIAWVMDEAGEEEHTDSVFGALQENKVLVPPLWFYEVANVVMMNKRRGRLSQKELIRVIRLLQSIPVVVDPDGAHRALETLDLAASHTLTVYDAIYLDLAMRMDLPLATLDKKLIEAAQTLGVTVL